MPTKPNLAKYLGDYVELPYLNERQNAYHRRRFYETKERLLNSPVAYSKAIKLCNTLQLNLKRIKRNPILTGAASQRIHIIETQLQELIDIVVLQTKNITKK